jgi:6-phosphogluconolactonase
LTLPVINRARQVIFLVSGEEKSEIMKEVLENSQSNLPASHVRPANGDLFFLLDKDAALFLSQDKTALKK